MQIELNVFTNSTDCIEYHQPIFETIKSFKETFGDIKMNIWFDKSPNQNGARNYLKTLTKQFNVKLSNSLSDGYIKAINESQSDFIFMLEHDWIFNKEYITHKLDDICKIMDEDNIHHLKFSPKDNDLIVDKTNHWLYPIEYIHGDMPYHLVQSASNNPHVINKRLYLKDLINRVKVDSGSLGIEHNLTHVTDAKFAVYGGPELKATINHTDGRLAWNKE